MVLVLLSRKPLLEAWVALEECYQYSGLAGSVGGLNLFFNAVSWLAIFIVVACLCYFVCYGLGFLVVTFMPMFERYFRTGTALAATALTLFTMAGIIFYLNLRRS